MFPTFLSEGLNADERTLVSIEGVVTADTLGGPQKLTIVNEPGLYSLVLTSRKPEDKEFKRSTIPLHAPQRHISAIWLTGLLDLYRGIQSHTDPLALML